MNCSWCQKEIRGFRDELSESEHRISGQCQDCQDEFFCDTYRGLACSKPCCADEEPAGEQEGFECQACKQVSSEQPIICAGCEELRCAECLPLGMGTLCVVCEERRLTAEEPMEQEPVQ